MTDAAARGVDVAANLAAVRARIVRACEEVHRDPGDVTLVAVSKLHDASAVRAAHAAGQRDFGENYVQELVAKADALRDLPDLRWHAIGHVQRNKAKDVARVAACVQTVDDARLAEALARRADDRVLDVLLQVNVAGEAQKSGCSEGQLDALVAAVRALAPRLALRGLMTVPPLEADPRPHFARLRALSRSLGLEVVSMGMSADLEVAIEEGATLVRVGTAIFGERAKGLP